MAWTTPRTWAANEASTAANFNTHVRDNMLAAGEWTAYTPTWTSTSGTPAVGNGTITGRYIRTGKTCHYIAVFVTGTTTTYGTGSMRFGLPFTPLGTVRFNVTFTSTNPNVTIPICGFGSITTGQYADLYRNHLAAANIGMWTNLFYSDTHCRSASTFVMSGTYETT